MQRFFNGLSTVIRETLGEAFERCLIDWTPDDGAPETFEAELEIEFRPPIVPEFHRGDICTTMRSREGDILVFFEVPFLTVWFSTRLDEVIQ